MEEISERESKKRLRDMADICKDIATRARIKPADLVDSQSPDVARARYLAIYLCSRHTGASIDELAEFFEVSRGAITYGIRMAREMLNNNSPASQWIRDLADEVWGRQ